MEPKISSVEVPSGLGSTSLASTPCPDIRNASRNTTQATKMATHSSPSSSRGRKRRAPDIIIDSTQDPDWLIIPSSRASSDPPPAKRQRDLEDDPAPRVHTLPTVTYTHQTLPT